MAGPVHTETLRNIRLGSHDLQQFIHAVLDIPILVPFCTVSGMDNGQQIMGLRHMQAYYFLHGGLPSDRDVLSCLFTLVMKDAIAQVCLFQIGHIDKSHPTGVEAEKEHVAGKAFTCIAEADMFDTFDFIDGQGALVGLGMTAAKTAITNLKYFFIKN